MGVRAIDNNDDDDDDDDDDDAIIINSAKLAGIDYFRLYSSTLYHNHNPPSPQWL
jgi:hypothetical protein